MSRKTVSIFTHFGYWTQPGLMSAIDPWKLLPRLSQVFVAGRPTGPASLTPGKSHRRRRRARRPSCQSSKIHSLLFSSFATFEKRHTNVRLDTWRTPRQFLLSRRLTLLARGFPALARCARRSPRPLAHNSLVYSHVRTERCCLVLHCSP